MTRNSPLLALALCLGCGETRFHFEGDPLNPDQYRAQIVAIDAIVFEDGPLGASEREELSSTMLGLGGVTGKNTANTIARAHSRELRLLSALAKRTKLGTPLLGSPLRQQWLRIRSGLFDDAWWFRRSSADPIEPAVAGPPPPSPLRPPTADERLGLELTLVSLEALVERAKRDLPNEYESEAHRDFVTDAERELAVDSVRLGPKPPGWGIDVFYKDAYQSAAYALQNIRMLVGLGTGAPRSSRGYLIGKIEEHLGRVREAVARFPK